MTFLRQNKEYTTIDEEEGLEYEERPLQSPKYRSKQWILKMLLGLSIVGILILIIAVLTGKKENGSEEGRKDLSSVPLILISIDGFRSDYIDRGLTPTLARLANEGVMALRMTPSFPSLTFPNHYTLVTGLYPESHGIVANAFYAPEYEEGFSYVNSSSTDGRFWKGEPIWNLVENQGMKSGVVFLPGSSAMINGKRPSFYLSPYDGHLDGNTRVDHILQWIEQKASFLGLYFSDVDDAGHLHGTNSAALNQSLIKVDGHIAYLVSQLEKRNIKANILIVSDHGMADYHQVLDTNQVIAPYKAVVFDSSAFVSIWPQNVSVDEMYHHLLNQSVGKGFQVFKRDNNPFNYTQSSRISPIFLLADLGYAFSSNPAQSSLRGTHGYNPNYIEMSSLFVAHGPSILSHSNAFTDPSHRLDPFPNIHIFPLMASLLNLKPSPCNGTGLLSELLLHK